MATLELSTLSDYLDEDEIGAVQTALDEHGASPLDIDETAEAVVLHRGIDDDIFVDFVDRLEASEVSADIYLPVDFEDPFDVADYKIGSSHALLLALETLREELSIDGIREVADDDEEEESEEEQAGDDDMEFDSLDEEEEDDDLDDDDSADKMKDDHLRLIWQIMHQGAKTAIKRGLCLVVKN